MSTVGSLAADLAVPQITLSELAVELVSTDVPPELTGFVAPIYDQNDNLVDWVVDPLSVVLNGDPGVMRLYRRWRKEWTRRRMQVPAGLVDPRLPVQSPFVSAWRTGSLVPPEESVRFGEQLTNAADNPESFGGDRFVYGKVTKVDRPSAPPSFVALLTSALGEVPLLEEGDAVGLWSEAGLHVLSNEGDMFVHMWASHENTMFVFGVVERPTRFEKLTTQLFARNADLRIAPPNEVIAAVSRAAGQTVSEQQIVRCLPRKVDIDSSMGGLLWQFGAGAGKVRTLFAFDAFTRRAVEWLTNTEGPVAVDGV